MNEETKRKYVIKNPHPRKTWQVNVILDDAQYKKLKDLADGKRLTVVIRDLIEKA